MDRLICKGCGAGYPLDDLRWKCDCGSFLDIEFDFSFDIEKIQSRKPTLWRYREAIPMNKDENIISFNEGFTPLLELTIDGKRSLVKLEQLFPTGSFKDRGASVLMSKAKELGVNKVVEDSSGNAGCAVAAYSAKAGIECDIFVPEKTSPGKLAQIQMYGANMKKIPGSREDTARATLEAAKDSFYASHVWNPFFFQGTKTFAFEIWEQLNFSVPDMLIIPTGHGTLFIGAYLGFKDLLNQKLIAKLPRLIAVQPEACAPLYKMFHEKLKEVPRIEPKETMAEGIRIAEPLRAKQILDILLETEGQVIIVTEKEIERSLFEICKNGLYVEPTSAAAIAGFRKYKSKSAAKETIVVPLTGHGLKSTEKVLKIFSKYSKQLVTPIGTADPPAADR
jgi:threonine synthase